MLSDDGFRQGNHGRRHGLRNHDVSRNFPGTAGCNHFVQQRTIPAEGHRRGSRRNFGDALQLFFQFERGYGKRTKDRPGRGNDRTAFQLGDSFDFFLENQGLFGRELFGKGRFLRNLRCRGHSLRLRNGLSDRSGRNFRGNLHFFRDRCSTLWLLALASVIPRQLLPDVPVFRCIQRFRQCGGW